MRKDSIIDELHEIRRDYAGRFGHDLHKIFADLKDQERRSGKKFLDLPVKRKHEIEGCDTSGRRRWVLG